VYDNKLYSKVPVYEYSHYEMEPSEKSTQKR